MLRLVPTFACLVLALHLGCGGGEERPREEGGSEEASPAAGQATGPDRDERGRSFPPETGEDPRILIRETRLRVTPTASLHIAELLGRLERLQEAPAWFDEPSSFAIRVERAETTMTGDDLAALMNEHVFAYDGAPLSGLSVEIRNDRLHQEGTLEKAIPVSFSMEARVEVTDEGDLRLVPEEIHAAGVPVESLLDFLGVELAQMLDTEKARGVTVVEDDLILDPEVLMPPPYLRARAESVSLEGGLLHLTLVRSRGEAISAEGLQPSDPDAPHFLFFQGGEVRFDKLTMRATDLQLVDKDPEDPFDFYLKRLQDQLVAGVSLIQPDEGLLVVLPDYDELER
jgi:hypothetical protein